MKKYLSYVTKYLKKVSYGPRLKPSRDWRLLLAGTAFLLLLSVAFNIWIFIESERGKILGNVVATPVHQTVTIPITAVQDVFKKRATQENAFQSAYSFVDPSVPGS